jgi:hypothetical protein
MNDTNKSAKNTTTTGNMSEGFSDQERAAIKQRAQELKATARRGPRGDKANGERDLLAKITEMPEPDRAMAERLHAINQIHRSCFTIGHQQTRPISTISSIELFHLK